MVPLSPDILWGKLLFSQIMSLYLVMGYLKPPIRAIWYITKVPCTSIYLTITIKSGYKKFMKQVR